MGVALIHLHQLFISTSMWEVRLSHRLYIIGLCLEYVWDFISKKCKGANRDFLNFGGGGGGGLESAA